MIKFVLGKTTFSPQYSLSYYVNKEKLLGINETIDPLVFEYIQSYMSLVKLVVMKIPSAELIVDDPDDIEAFVILPFTNESDWNDFFNSPDLTKFINVANKLYPLIGWVDNGFKIVNTLDEPLIKTKSGLQKIWDNN